MFILLNMEKESKFNKIASWYVALLFLVAFIVGLLNLFRLIIVESGSGIGGEMGLGYVLLIFFIVIVLISAFMIFLGFKIKRDITWAKITTLIIFILSVVVSFKISLISATRIFCIILSTIGIILISLSLKSLK